MHCGKRTERWYMINYYFRWESSESFPNEGMLQLFRLCLIETYSKWGAAMFVFSTSFDWKFWNERQSLGCQVCKLGSSSRPPQAAGWHKLQAKKTHPILEIIKRCLVPSSLSRALIPNQVASGTSTFAIYILEIYDSAHKLRLVPQEAIESNGGGGVFPEKNRFLHRGPDPTRCK